MFLFVYLFCVFFLKGRERSKALTEMLELLRAYRVHLCALTFKDRNLMMLSNDKTHTHTPKHTSTNEDWGGKCKDRTTWMMAATSTYTEQSNWLNVNRAFYRSWESVPETSMRGQENISLGGGDCMPWAPLVLSEFQRNERSMDEWRKILEFRIK